MSARSIAYNKWYRANNAEKVAASVRRRKEAKPKGWMTFYHRRRSAKKDGIPFTIKFEEINFPDYCPALGIKLNYGPGLRSSIGLDRPSLDRVIPDLGYVPGNVAVISWRANKLKNNATVEELTKLSCWMRRMTT